MEMVQSLILESTAHVQKLICIFEPIHRDIISTHKFKVPYSELISFNPL